MSEGTQNAANAAGADPAAWPPELDALIAAPDNHALLFENEQVRVLETVIKPGDETPVHTHCWPCSMVVVSIDHFVRRDGQGAVMLDTRLSNPAGEFPKVMWSGPLPPHTLENVGQTEIRVISTELKGANPAR